MIDNKCVECGSEGIKKGWTNCWYCCEECERSGVSRLHASIPGTGPIPHHGWVPYHISVEINRRWNDFAKREYP